MGDGDLLAMSFLVHLRLPDVEQESGGLVFDVGEVERDQLSPPHGGGVAEQDDRGVADAVRGGAVDAADDLADLLDRQWPGEASRCGAVGSAQAAADLADGLGGDRVDGPVGAVDVPDDGAGHVEGAGGAARFGAFSQVGAYGEGVGRHGGDAALGAPSLPLAPDHVVEASRAIGAGGGKGLGDARGVDRGEPGAGQVRIIGSGAEGGSGGSRQRGDHKRVHRPVVAVDVATNGGAQSRPG